MNFDATNCTIKLKCIEYGISQEIPNRLKMTAVATNFDLSLCSSQPSWSTRSNLLNHSSCVIVLNFRKAYFDIWDLN